METSSIILKTSFFPPLSGLTRHDLLCGMISERTSSVIMAKIIWILMKGWDKSEINQRKLKGFGICSNIFRRCLIIWEFGGNVFPFNPRLTTICLSVSNLFIFQQIQRDGFMNSWNPYRHHRSAQKWFKNKRNTL